MPDDFNLEMPPERRLEGAGFRLTRLEKDPSIVYLLGADLRIVYCNKAWDDFAASNGGVGINRAAILGASVMEAMAVPLRPFYARAFTWTQKKLRTWEHDFECSSPELYRLFHMRVLPLADAYLMVESSLRVERLHGPEHPGMPSYPFAYVNGHGIVTMCSHCRRTQRLKNGGAAIWDFGAGLRREMAAARVAKIVSQLRGVFLCRERRASLNTPGLGAIA